MNSAEDNTWVDFHCHILPGVDDGAKNKEKSAQMLCLLYEQGVRHCVLTPHFYPRMEPLDEFLERREKGYAELLTVYDGSKMPKLALGAEVHISKSFSKKDLSKLTVNGTDNILIEFPFTDFEQWMVHEVEQVIYDHGLSPIIAHIDRVESTFSKQHFFELLEFDEFIFQINNEAFEGFFSRKKMLSVFEPGYFPCVLGSDSHGMEKRRPNFDIAKKYIAENNKASELYENVKYTSKRLKDKIFN